MKVLNLRRSLFISSHLVSTALLTISSSQVNAAILQDIGYEALVTELGVSVPIGSGVAVNLVEARTTCSGTAGSDCYRPDPGTTTAYTAQSGSPTGVSAHATGSANAFYGSTSTSPGITNIDVYAAGHWLGGGYLNSSTVSEPMPGTFVITNSTMQPATSSTRVSSHSYVGAANIPSLPGNTLDLELLQRMDFLADKDDHIVTVAMNNGTTNRPLNGSAYNVITVGRTDGLHPQGTVDVNPGAGLYNSTIRSGADIVVPESTTSAATPRVASAAALLVGYGHDQGTAKSNGTITTRDSSILHHAETSEVIKASLMAGASRSTSNIAVAANITDYRSAGNQTTNGLDTRFGAGQLNIQNSYHILAAGEQDAGSVLSTGFDYDAAFGSNSTASYLFTNSDDNAWFAASLVWNILFDDSESEFVTSVGTLFDLNLELYSEGSLIASSTSAIDNTENLWLQLAIGDYRLDVTSNGVFGHDYGLAWQTAPVPVPAAFWLFSSAMIMLFRSRKSQTVH